MSQRLVPLWFVMSTACLTACTVGDVTGYPAPGDDTVAPDGGEVAPDGGPGPDGASQAACEPAATVLPNGRHNAGQACLTCHDGGGAPLFTVAGTLYTSAAGTTPLSAATIIVHDANGATFKLITATNGNFYTGQTVALPVTVEASKCPDNAAMSASAQTGDCNSCHTAGGTGRVHLP